MQSSLWLPSVLAQLVCTVTLLQCLEGTAVQQILDARSEPRCYCPEDDSAKAVTTIATKNTLLTGLTEVTYPPHIWRLATALQSLKGVVVKIRAS